MGGAMVEALQTLERPRVAVFELASCAGCQLQILNCEDELVELLQLVEFAYFKAVSYTHLTLPTILRV